MAGGAQFLGQGGRVGRPRRSQGRGMGGWELCEGEAGQEVGGFGRSQTVGGDFGEMRGLGRLMIMQDSSMAYGQILVVSLASRPAVFIENSKISIIKHSLGAPS